MPFTLVMSLLVFIFPVMTGIVLFKRYKRTAVLFFSIPAVAVAAVAGWWIYEVNDQFVRSTDLPDERIGEVALLSQVDSDFKAEYGPYEESDNVFYHKSLDFPQFHIGTNEDDDIIYIAAYNSGMPTGKGLSVGDTLEDAAEAYGEHYYSRSDMGVDTIGYVDREQDISIEFDHRDQKVTGIRLYYDD